MTGGVPRKGKPIICLDFDGVIHSYENGWQEGVIYGHVTEGFFDWVEEAVQHFDLHIYSSRSKTAAGRLKMQEWLVKEVGHWAPAWQAKEIVAFIEQFTFSHEKPPAFLTIDDRAMTFEGSWADFHPEEIIQFKPWNQR